MRDVYRAFGNRLGTDQAIMLAHELDSWHGEMTAHRDELIRLGFSPDGHATWKDCPHVDARRLWARVVELGGANTNELEFLQTCSGTRPPQ